MATKVRPKKAVIDTAGTVVDAAACGDVALLNKLLAQGQNVTDVDDLGSSPLHHACTNGHLSMVQHLMKKSAEVNVATSSGITPLMCAASNGHGHVLAFLLEQGADVEAETTDGISAVDLAHLRYHSKIVAQLLREAKQFAQTDDMFTATRLPDLVFMRDALYSGKVKADATCSPEKQTLLMAACTSGSASAFKAVRFLLRQPELDVNALDEQQCTAVHLTIQQGEGAAPVLEQLISCERIRLDVRDPKGATPFLFALERDHRTLLEILARRPFDLDVNSIDDVQEYWWDYVSRHNDSTILPFLRRIFPSGLLRRHSNGRDNDASQGAEDDNE